MAQLIITITKDSANTPWIMLNSPEELAAHFTPDEIANILVPFRDHVRIWPGRVSTSSRIIDDTTMEIVHLFDTTENALLAKEEVDTYPGIPIVQAHKDLLLAKRNELGMNYTYTNRVV